MKKNKLLYTTLSCLLIVSIMINFGFFNAYNYHKDVYVEWQDKYLEMSKELNQKKEELEKAKVDITYKDSIIFDLERKVEKLEYDF